MRNYRERIADEMLRDRLRRKGAVLVVGPKWCGKTTTAMQLSASSLYMADPMKKKEYADMATMNVQMLLAGATPRLIDEWQLEPSLWDSVRFEVDKRDEVGQFILTGSSVPPDKSKIFHSGTGRFARLRMRTMSLWESGDSSGDVSLFSLFLPDAEVAGMNRLTLEDVAYLMCRGGWPGALTLKRKDALAQAYDYYDLVCDSDMSRFDGMERDPQRVRRLMRSLARNQGTPATISTLLADMKANDSETLSDNTVYDYLKVLDAIFVTEDMEAWNPNIRSKTTIRTSNNRYFSDPSIAAAALGFSPADIMADIKTMGLMFETMAMRDLRAYTDALDGNVFHYRDKTGLECDAVIHLRNGSYGLVEIKLGGERLIEEGVESLQSLANLIDTNRMKAPSFMMVLTAVGEYAYRRKDGILIVPIGSLKQ